MKGTSFSCSMPGYWKLEARSLEVVSGLAVYLHCPNSGLLLLTPTSETLTTSDFTLVHYINGITRIGSSEQEVVMTPEKQVIPLCVSQ